MRRRQAITQVPTRPTWVLAAATALGLVLGVVPVSADEWDFLVAAGAEQVQKEQLSDTSSGVIYMVEMPYPLRAVGQIQWRELEAMGWTRCHGGNTDWVSFRDETVPSKRVVHQLVTNWSRGGRLLTIGLRYYSFDLPGQSRPVYAAPNNKLQFVDITFENDPERRDAIVWRALGCSSE